MQIEEAQPLVQLKACCSPKNKKKVRDFIKRVTVTYCSLRNLIGTSKTLKIWPALIGKWLWWAELVWELYQVFYVIIRENWSPVTAGSFSCQACRGLHFTSHALSAFSPWLLNSVLVECDKNSPIHMTSFHKLKDKLDVQQFKVC